jgi:glycosyltransferase involved in cell wall biosynthesis
LVTIGITSFNAAATIERAVRSALAQTWRPIEIVAVDDASGDESAAILAQLAAAHPEVRVFVQTPNGGVAAARNRIIAEARGEFVAFFDDDDVSLPDRVAQQVSRLTTYERQFADCAPVVCHTSRQLVYPDGVERVEPTMGMREGVPAPAGAAVADRILMGKPLEDGYGACPTCSQLARLSTYQALGGFDTTLRRSEDTEFSVRAGLAGAHFVGVSAPMVTQYMTRTSEKSVAEEHRNMLLVLEKYRQRLERAGQYDFCRRWLGAKHLWLQGKRASFGFALAKLALAHPILTFRRLAISVPTLGTNRAFRGFHQTAGEH